MSVLFPYHFLKLEMSFSGTEGRLMAVTVPNWDAVEGPSTIEEAEALTTAEAGQVVPYISDRMCSL